MDEDDIDNDCDSERELGNRAIKTLSNRKDYEVLEEKYKRRMEGTIRYLNR